jgi:hypothetical protein
MRRSISSSRPATLCVRSWVSREMRCTALASAAETGGRAVDEVLTNRLAALQDAIARGDALREVVGVAGDAVGQDVAAGDRVLERREAVRQHLVPAAAPSTRC